MRSITFSVHRPERASRLQLMIRAVIAPFAICFLILFNILHDLLWLPRALRMLISRRRLTTDYEWGRQLPAVCYNWLAYLLLLTDYRPMKAAEVKTEYDPQPVRFELFFRPFYLVMLHFNTSIFFVLAALALAMQFFFILLLDRKNAEMTRLLDAFCRYVAKMKGYQNLVYDERPPLYPEELLPHKDLASDLQKL